MIESRPLWGSEHVAHPAGTIFVLRSGGILGWLIRLLTRSRVNHAGICIGFGKTVEAQMSGAAVHNEHDRSPEVIFGSVLFDRIQELHPGKNTEIAWQVSQLVGTKYNFLDLLALAWACRRDPTGPLEKPNRWQRRVMRDDRLICSQLVDLACLRAGVHLFSDGRLPGQVAPGDLEEVIANPDWPIKCD